MVRNNKPSGLPTWAMVLIGVGVCMAAVGMLVFAGMLWIGKNADDAIQESAEESKRHENIREQDIAHAASGKSDLTLAQFRIQRPDEPKVVRVQIELSDYYNYDFNKSQSTHYSFSLSGTRRPNEPAWMPKTHKDAKRLYDLTKDAQKHWVTLRLQWKGPDGKPTPVGHQGITVLDVVSFD